MRNETRSAPVWFASKGVSLIELMVALAILAILVSLAMPSFRDTSNASRAVAMANELVAALNLARSEAVKRGVPVTVCKTADPDASAPSCASGGDWTSGLLVFTDGGVQGSVDGTDTRLRVKQPSGRVGSVVGDANFSDFVTYLPSGASQGSGGSASGTLTICVGNSQRSVAVSGTGRVRVDKGAC
ncbi:GspH/FimT family pseudopilin [Methylogaea oryzae]|uniref:Type II secretion system protein H n=1 Tax=Methylogaea oryzae TaxID=1295382 RepID=A0A8D4VPQ5_9GAMM|nr:GspH/FimT family pseudopilin [Methylogaea oryzae]BBL71778.1 hypothetical protein MoryE10_23840 [Methylogaea oryzae]